MIRYKKLCSKTYNENDQRAKDAWEKFCKPLGQDFQLSEYDLKDCNQPDIKLKREGCHSLYFELQVSRSWGGTASFHYQTFDLFHRKYRKLSSEWSHLKDKLFFVTLSDNLQKAIVAPANLFEHLGTQKERPMERPGEGYGPDSVVSLEIKYCTEVGLSQAPYEQLEKMFKESKQVLKNTMGRAC